MGEGGLLDHHQAARLDRRADDGGRIQRHQSPGVHHLHLDALPGEFLGRLQRGDDPRADGHQCHIASLPLHLGHADGNDVFVLRDLACGQIQHLVLEEEDGVVGADGRFEQPLGVVGGAGGDDDEARYPRQERVEGLGMLSGQAEARPAGGANHQRQGILPARHVPQLGRLVDDGVHAAGEEVGEHDLGHRPHPRHGRSHRRAHDGVLADGRVEHPLRAELLHQAGGDGEIAAGGHVLAQDEDPLVAPHLLGQGLADGLGVGYLPHPAGGLDPLPVKVGRLRREDVLSDGGRVRIGALLGEGQRLLDGPLGLAFHLLEIGLGDGALGQEPGLEALDGAPGFPLLHLLLAAIAGRFPLGVAAPAIGEALDKRRPLAPPGPRHRLPHRLVDGPDVVAVHGDAGHGVGCGAVGEALHLSGACQGGELAVEVVLDDKDSRQVKEGGEVHGLVEHPLVGRPIAEEGQGHLIGAAHFGREGRARRYHRRGTHDAVGPQRPHAGVGDMHGAALALAEAGALAEDLGHHPLEIGPLGQHVAVPAMGGGHVVAPPEGEAGPHRAGFLANGEVEYLRGNAPLGELPCQRLLEGADEHHPPQHLHLQLFLLGGQRLLDELDLLGRHLLHDGDEVAAQGGVVDFRGPAAAEEPLQEPRPRSFLDLLHRDELLVAQLPQYLGVDIEGGPDSW